MLIADDHRLFAEALEAVLSTEERIEVVGRAADGSEAVELARKLDPDVVALDISMPVMDGFEAAAELERFAHPPAVLMLTGSNEPEDVDSGAARWAQRDTSRRTRSRRGSSTRSSRRPASPPRTAATLQIAMVQVSAVFQVIVSVALLALILMHSGRDAGLGGMGFTPASQGGTHIVERNLTRLTVVVATVFFLNSVVLYRLLA